jgi:hypothetical protein
MIALLVAAYLVVLGRNYWTASPSWLGATPGQIHCFALPFELKTICSSSAIPQRETPLGKRGSLARRPQGRGDLENGRLLAS